MLLSNQFPELFRRELYAVKLCLFDEGKLNNPFDEILRSRPIDGIWDKEYSMVPIGELEGRKEAEPIPQKNMTMGYTAYGAVAVEASAKVNLSKRLKEKAREFSSPQGVDEQAFAGSIADTIGRSMEERKATRWHMLAARIFNYGGIAAGHAFFNQRVRAEGLSDLPNSNLIYDGLALFALPTAPHTSYAAGSTSGPGSRAVGTCVNFAATIADTGGYFNAFQLPPSYWALKRVFTHFMYNMAFDENDVRFYQVPDTLLVSSYNLPKWTEILNSKFVEPDTSTKNTNIENIFMLEGFKVRLVHSPLLLANTWFLGKAKSKGIEVMTPTAKDDPWSYYRDEDNRSYFISFEAEWGMMISNWRNWVAGSISTDGSTPPDYGAESAWDVIPAGC